MAPTKVFPMTLFFDTIYHGISGVPRRYKNLILLSLDTVLLPVCLYLAFALRLDTFTPFIGQDKFWTLHLLLTFSGIAIILISGQHRVKLHNFEINSVYQIGLSTAGLFLSFIMLLYLFRFWAPRSVPIIFAMLFFFSTVGSRVVISLLLNQLKMQVNKAAPVAIYGTGSTAMQILSALNESEVHEPICFFDENSALHGAIIGNIRVESPANLNSKLKKKNIQEVYIALPDASDAETKSIVGKISGYGVKVCVAPTVMQLLLDHSRDILSAGMTPDDLLGRDKIMLNSLDISSGFKGKSIIVTGAGGSIGSELSRQILEFAPKKLVLFDSNEFALYKIGNELADRAAKLGTQLVSKLGSVVDEEYLEFVLTEERVQMLFHAAAYKHVSLVEKNILEAARNNVLGTYCAATAAGKVGLEKFVLVSTDKAVRPTNIMGATKRLAELVTHSCSQLYPRSIYAVVRFGNVLGSSGSVVPLFKKQISYGGPVTVTNPNVTRYFMTIPEASKLVLLAGFFSSGGDTFVLDMGEPVKILDLAKRMIELSGNKLKNGLPSEEGIAIEFVGLRSGEKLHEELLFDRNELVETPHEKIFRIKEKIISEKSMDNIVDEITRALSQRDEPAIVRLISVNVEGFYWNSEPNDTSFSQNHGR